MPEHISLEALAALPVVTALKVSKDGEHLAFYANWTGRFEIYIQNLRTNERTQLTNGEAAKTPRSSLHWSKNDKYIYFSRDNDGDERQAIYELNVESKAVKALQHDPESMDHVADTHPDGRHLLVNSTRAGQMNAHLYNLEKEGISCWTQLTQQENTTRAMCFSPDGLQIAFNTNESKDLRNTDGYLINTDGNSLKRVLSIRDGSQDFISAWHPDGDQLAISSDADGNKRAGLFNLSSNEITWLTPQDEGIEEHVVEFSPNGQYLSVLRLQDSTITPILYDVATKEAKVLKLPAGLAFGASFALGSSHLITSFSTSTTRSKVLLYDLATDTYSTLIPAEYGEIDPKYFVPDEYMHYPSTDDVQVPAILYRPRDLEPGKKYPALVHVHGGPTAQFFRNFDPQAQFLADRGYFVLCPNVRGSTGYGVKWRDANLLDWGGRDLEDVAAGAEYLKSLEQVDPQRLGVFGGSYGGYISYLAAVKKPDLFKVSIPIVGITDLHKLYEDNLQVMPQLSYYFKTMMGDPKKNHNLWRDRSAITFADQLKAHMFMMHGSNDPRCPINQARNFRDKLIEFGRKEDEHFEYIEFDDQGHGSADIAGKTRSYQLLVDYLARRL